MPTTYIGWKVAWQRRTRWILRWPWASNVPMPQRPMVSWAALVKSITSRSRRGSFLSTQLVRPHLEHWSSSGLPSTGREVAPRRPFTVSRCAFLHRSTVTRAAHPIQLWVTQYLIELSSPNYSPPSKRISDCRGNWLAVMGLKENEWGQLT